MTGLSDSAWNVLKKLHIAASVIVNHKSALLKQKSLIFTLESRINSCKPITIILRKNKGYACLSALQGQHITAVDGEPADPNLVPEGRNRGWRLLILLHDVDVNGRRTGPTSVDR